MKINIAHPVADEKAQKITEDFKAYKASRIGTIRDEVKLHYRITDLTRVGKAELISMIMTAKWGEGWGAALLQTGYITL